MPELISAPPVSAIEPVTEILHGVAVTDPYRWLEDQNSLRTRAWIEEQTCYARAYLDNIPGRDRIRQRIREFLAVETYDSLQKSGHRYFFRKRLPNQEQPCIYMRDGVDGQDQLLVDPTDHGPNEYTAVKPLGVSPDGRLLLFEVKEGGERTGRFKLIEIEERRVLPEVLPRGYLRGFAFAPNGESFYYTHEAIDPRQPDYRAAYHHVFGTNFREDHEVFCGGEDPRLRLGLVSDTQHIGFLLYRFGTRTRTDFYLQPFDSKTAPEHLLADAHYIFVPVLLKNRVFALTDRDAPNFRIVELRPQSVGETEWIDVIPEKNSRIHQWLIAADRILVSYICKNHAQVLVFDLEGKPVGEIETLEEETLRLLNCSHDSEVFVERESFIKPIAVSRYCPSTGKENLWAKRNIPFDPKTFTHMRVWFDSKDGTRIPMFLVGGRNIVSEGCHPAIMTSYGGYGVSMSPQFSVFVAFLIERGCLFALPSIRGGSEFGAEWHDGAKRRKRQNAYDDFLSAAEWLIKTGRTTPEKLAIFGGSNSGLLVAAAMTQRPELFRAVVCMVPLLDMLRYHLFNNAHVWWEEFGTAEDPEDFSVLHRYSPYHQVRDSIHYPATMIVSGDADQNCNALHARKMTARLQAANASGYPIFLDYSEFRGHSPVLPLSERIKALTDRMAFLCDQLQLAK